jgi:hypothetical protein
LPPRPVSNVRAKSKRLRRRSRLRSIHLNAPKR